MNVGSAFRIGQRALALLPRAVAAVRPFWNTLPKAQKVAVLAAASAVSGTTATALLSSTGSDAEIESLMQTHVLSLTDKTPDEAATLIAAMYNAVDDQQKGPLVGAVKAALGGGADAEEVNHLIEIVASRVSASAHTGDGEAKATTDGAGYDRIIAAQQVIKRAMQALGYRDPSAVRALRDAVFMDEQVFTAAVERM